MTNEQMKQFNKALEAIYFRALDTGNTDFTELGENPAARQAVAAAIGKTVDDIAGLLAWHAEAVAQRRTPSAPAAAGLLDAMVKKIQDYRQEYVNGITEEVLGGAQ